MISLYRDREIIESFFDYLRNMISLKFREIV